MLRRASRLLALLISAHLGSAAALAQFKPGDFDYTSTVNAAQVSQPNPPTAASVPVHVSDPTAMNPDLILTFFTENATLQSTAGSGNSSVDIGTISHSFAPGNIVTETTYNININYVFQVTIVDHSYNDTSNPYNSTGLITGTITGTITRRLTGNVKVDLSHVMTTPLTASTRVVSTGGRATTYTLTFSDYSIYPSPPKKFEYRANGPSPNAFIMTWVTSIPR